MASSPLHPIALILRRRPASSGPPRTGLDVFEAELVSRLKSDAALAPLVEGRIYPLLVPERPRPKGDGSKTAKLPAIVYQIVSNDRVRYLRGPAGMATAVVMFYCRSTKYGDAKKIREALRRFDAWRGVLVEDVSVAFAAMLDQSDEFEWPAGLGTDRGTYNEVLGFRFKYREPIIRF